MNSLTDIVIGFFLICMWFAYGPDKLVHDMAAFISRILT